MTLRWADNSPNETSFRIERALADLVFSQVGTVAANVTEYTDTSVAPATTYFYRVRASGASGDSAYSNTITATAPAGDATAPFVSPLSDVTIAEGKSVPATGFTVTDAQSPAANLFVTATSSNPSLVPASGIVLGGAGSNRTISIAPAAHQSGTATITVAANDGMMTSLETFLLTVTPANGAPEISDIPNQITSTGSVVGPIPFAIAGADAVTGSWSVTGESSNPTLVPDTNISFGGSGNNRTVMVVPVAGQNGATTITVSVSLGVVLARSSFTITVGPGSTRTFSNAARVAVVDTTAASPYPSSINVTGLAGVVTGVTVALERLAHSWTSDVDVLVVSPTGRSVLVMSDAGSGPTAGATLTFSDAASSSLPQLGSIGSGLYTPTNYDTVTDTFPPPAPAAGYSASLAAFLGQPATGQWLLFINDDMPEESGELIGGWSITLTTVATGPAPPRISSVAHQTIGLNSATAALPFTLEDPDSPASNLVLSARSSNPSLVPVANIEFGGNGANRTIKVTPALAQTGTSTITVVASDGVLNAMTTFVVKVGPPEPTSPDLPAITSPVSASSTVGLDFVYAISATNTPSGFDAFNLPPGLSVNQITGMITGAPTTPGTFAVSLRAANSSGMSEASLNLQVDAASAPLDQIITIHAGGGLIIVGQPLTLRATATSGLPVSFSVVSGNAVIKGNTVTVFDTRPVIVQATQGGSDHFNPANSQVVVANAASSTGSLIYSGTIGTDLLAAVFDVQSSSGTLYTRLSSPSEALIVPLSIASDGTFVATVTSMAENNAATQRRTFRGRLQNGTLSGTLDELTRNFSATLRPGSGPARTFTGSFTANTLLSASGTTHLIVSATGESYILAITPAGVTAGSGVVSPDGEFTIRTPQDFVIAGSINPIEKTITGTIQFPSQPGASELLGTADAISRRSGLVNLSSLARVGGSAGSLISGIVLAGSTAKQMLLRAIGPTLATFGVPETLRNPRLQLYDSRGRMVARNDDWANLVAAGVIGDRAGAFRLAPNSLDAALLTTINPGAYTVEVNSNGGDGVALVELYDVTEDFESTGLVNLSTRGYIEPGANALTAGFVVQGNAPMRLLVRGIGPALGTFGVSGFLPDPVLRIHQNALLVAENDNWGSPQTLSGSQHMASSTYITELSNRVGAFPTRTGSLDAAIIVTLAPGAYTASVSGSNNSSGSGLLEIYRIPLE